MDAKSHASCVDESTPIHSLYLKSTFEAPQRFEPYISDASIMPTLLDHIDRFSLAASSLTRTAEDSESSLTNGDPGPFARAVLHASGMDVIRDALDSELGLFTLVPSMSAISSSQGQPHAVAGAQARVGKVEFGEATPLRKGRVAARLQRDLDADAEIYAEAALKFLDR